MSWKTVTLGDVCELYQPKTITSKELIEDGEFDVYGANGIIGKYSNFNHEHEQLVIGCRGSVGSVHITRPKSWITGNAMVVNPKIEGLSLRFLEYFFRGPVDLSKAITGTAQPQITRKSLSPISFSFPSLATQHKIVEKLDAIFAEIDRATVATEANVKNAEALFQSYLTDIFNNDKSDFIIKSIGEIGEVISGSGFPVNHQGQLDEEIPFYKVSDMNIAGNEKVMISHNNSISKETAKKLGAKIIPAKSVIFPKIGGAIATNKKRILSVPSCVDNNVMGIFPNNKMINSEFFFHLLSSIELSSFANEAALPSIKKSTVEERMVKIPSTLEEQEKICQLIESIKSNSTVLKDRYSLNLINLNSLKQSILKQAFSGELVKE